MNRRGKTEVKLEKIIGLLVTALLFFIPPAGLVSAQGQPKTILLATTTSTQDSGLLDVLLPFFQGKTGYFVKTIAVGSGQAMALGRRGEADLLLVHSPAAEKKFMAEGLGLRRRLVMHNDFVILGPPEDPGGIKGLPSSPESLKKIAAAKALFLSRGDQSGTHAKELEIWRAAGMNPEKEKWYQQTGLGMGQTLSVADEKKGYTLSDRGTFLALRKNLHLRILLEEDAALLNIYHTIEVHPERWPKVNAAGARALADFLVSPAAQAVIRSFGVEKFGAPLFFPDAGKKEEELAK